MAEANLDDIAGMDRFFGGASLSTYINGIGALLSVALVFGAIDWGYRLAVRDVTGVPVIRALKGPMKVQPEDPGGTEADHQGLALNRVQAEHPAEEVPAKLVLAPKPVSLAKDDSSAAQFAAEEAAVPNQEQEIAQALHEVVGDQKIKSDADLAVAAALAQDIVGKQLDIQDIRDASASLGSPLDDLPGPAHAVRPLLRPAETASAGNVTDLDPATLPVGTRLVQLGAFPDEAQAKKEWARLDSTYAPFMGDKQRVIQRTESSGRVFYRLRAAGFTDLADARRFCAAILSSEASCIPVLTR